MRARFLGALRANGQLALIHRPTSKPTIQQPSLRPQTAELPPATAHQRCVQTAQRPPYTSPTTLLRGTTPPRTPNPPVRHSVWLLFLYGALDSHPFFPSHVASGCFFPSAGAAGAPAGVVSAFAEPSGWCVGAVLDVARCAILIVFPT